MEPVVGIEPRLSGTDRAHRHDASSGGAALGDRNPSQPIPTAARLHGVNGKECARAPLTSTSNPEVCLCARWTVREFNPHLCFARAASSRWTNSPWRALSESNARLSIWNRSGHHDLRPVAARREIESLSTLRQRACDTSRITSHSLRVESRTRPSSLGVRRLRPAGRGDV